MGAAITIKEIERIDVAIKTVNQDLRDYHWLANYLEIYDSADYDGTPATATYGEDAAMPKAKYKVTDVTYNQAVRKMQAHERYEHYRNRVFRLEIAMSSLEDERERLVIELYAKRVTLRRIGEILNVSKQMVFKIKERAVQKLALYYLKRYIE